MGWPWTRKKNQKNQIEENKENKSPILENPSPEHIALEEKLKEEIRSLFQKRNARRVQFIRSLSQPHTLENQNSWWYKAYENEAIYYLIELLKQLQRDANPFFFNEAYADFLQRRNQLNMNQKSKNSLNSVLRKLRLYTRKITNKNVNQSPRPRSRTTSFSSFSNTESNTKSASLPSLQSLRAAIDPTLLNPSPRIRTRRLKGLVVKPNQGKLSPATV